MLSSWLQCAASSHTRPLVWRVCSQSWPCAEGADQHRRETAGNVGTEHEAKASAKMGKQPGSDGVVVEMVRALSWSTLLWLYLLYLVRLGGWETERPDAWREVVLTAIPKKSDMVGFRSMRYISLLPVTQKFYIRALQSAFRSQRKPT